MMEIKTEIYMPDVDGNEYYVALVRRTTGEIYIQMHPTNSGFWPLHYVKAFSGFLLEFLGRVESGE